MSVYNKITVNGTTLMDISSDTVDAAHLLSGYTAHGADGNAITGTYTAPSYSSQSKSVSYTPTESSQSATVTADNGYDGLSSVSVSVDAVSSSYVGSGITQRSSSDLTASGATVTVPSGYYSSSASKSVSTTTHPDPTVSVSSSGLITASHTQSAGYVSAGTTTATSQLTTQSAKTVTPTTSSQTAVASGRYTTGAVTVAAIPSQYIVPAGTKSITANGTGIDVTSYASVDVAVPTGGSSMNVQYYMGNDYVQATSYTATDVSLTVKTTGTYKVSWMGWRSTSSGTSGSQMYINGSAYGSANTTFTHNYGQNIILTGVSLDAGDVIVIRARSRSTSYYMHVGNLIIEQTA